MQPEHVHAVKMDQDFPNFSASALCEDIEPGKSAFAATKADRAELFWYIWHDLTLALVLAVAECRMYVPCAITIACAWFAM